MITWKESFSTGIAELDKQHKALFQYTNELGKTIEDKALSKQIVDQTMVYLRKYIEVHFNREETCMHQHACPIAGKNKEAHRKFIEKFKEMEEKISTTESNEDLVIELHLFLEHWLINHIGSIDTQLKSCVAK